MLGVCLINISLFDYTDIQGIVILLHGKTILKIMKSLLGKKTAILLNESTCFQSKSLNIC